MATQFDSAKALGFFWAVYKARPVAFIGLGIWTAIFTAVVGTLQYAPLMAYMEASRSVPQDDPAAVFASLGQFYGSLGPIWLVSMAGWIFLEAAWLRLFVRGRSTPLFPFRLGRDEGNFFLTLLALAGIFLGVYIAWIIGAVLVGMVLGLALAPISPALATGAIFAAMFASALPFFWVFVRFSPALALAVSRQKFSLGAAWSGTKGWFWSMFGVYLIAFLITMAVALIALAAAYLAGHNVINVTSGTELMPIGNVIILYLVQGALMVIPQAIMRGIAVKAALTIDEAAAPPVVTEA